MKKITGFVALVALLLASCSTPKDITYFQDFKSGQSMSPQVPLEIKLKPADEISIQVATRDPELSLLFSKNPNRGGSSTGSNNNEKGSDYTIDTRGFIDFPVLGELYVTGMNREEIQQYIKSRLIEENLVKDPIVTVKFTNLHVNVLGAIGTGRVAIDRDQFTLLDAISQSGDLDLTGQRQNVKVFRENYGKTTMYEVNLCSAEDLYNSPVYYLQQNDVIYVEPNNKTKRTASEYGSRLVNYSFWTGLLSSAISIWTLIKVFD